MPVVKWPFEIISYTDEHVGNINGFQKANGSNKIDPEDSEIFVNSENWFSPKNVYFSNNKIFSSFFEYTILWDVNATRLIKFEGLHMEVLIKIWNDPPKGDTCDFSFL